MIQSVWILIFSLMLPSTAASVSCIICSVKNFYGNSWEKYVTTQFFQKPHSSFWRLFEHAYFWKRYSCWCSLCGFSYCDKNRGQKPQAVTLHKKSTSVIVHLHQKVSEADKIITASHKNSTYASRILTFRSINEKLLLAGCSHRWLPHWAFCFGYVLN